MAPFAGHPLQVDVQCVTEVCDRRRRPRFQVQNRPSMAIQTGIGGEARFIRGPRLAACLNTRVAARARQTHRQVRPVPEIVRLPQQRASCRQHKTDFAQYGDDDINVGPITGQQ